MPLGPGSIAFTGFNADGSDDLAFVALEEIASGTVIYFNDQEWLGSAFNTGEGQVTWTANATIPAGTIVTINSFSASPTSNFGTLISSSGLGSDGEIVYAYVGAAFAPTAFLAAIANDGFAVSGGTLTGTGLVVGDTAIDLSNGGTNPGEDVAIYTGSRTGETSFAAYRAAINNPANWSTQDGADNQSNDGTAPDLPFSLAAFTTGSVETQSVSFQPTVVALNEGQAVTTGFTFTVTRSGGTTGQLDFSGTIAAGETDSADHQGGSVPTSFSGSIAAGSTSATVTVNIAGDATIEPDEDFILTLTSVTNLAGISAGIAGATATGTIVNDDAVLPDLAAGDIAFTGFNADGNDNLAFVALKAIDAGDTIYFQDNEWTGAAFNTGESSFSWTATSAIAQGTVITLDNISTGAGTASTGTLTYIDSSNLGISNSGEMVYAFTGVSATNPGVFLAAVANGGFTANGGTLAGTGLIEGTSAVDLGPLSAGGPDIASFTGARNDQTSFAGYAPLLNTASNWTFQDASGDQSADGTAPDVPFDASAFTLAAPTENQSLGFSALSVARIEQDAGEASTFTFTVTRSGGTTGQLDFSGTIGLGGTDAADFGGSAPTTFSGSIAAGSTSAKVTVTTAGDISIEADESFTLTLTGATNSAASVAVAIAPAASTATGTIRNDDAGDTIGGIRVYDPAASLEGDATPPTASGDFQLIRLGSIAGTPAGSEVVAFEDGVAYNMNNHGTQIDKFAVNADGTLAAAGIIDFTALTDFGGGNSVAVKDGLLAFAYNSATFGNAGHVALFDAATGSLIKIIDVGVGPDQITFSPDGTKLLTADEAERDNAGDNFAGGVSIIDLSGGAANAVLSNTIGFGALDGNELALINRGMAIAPGQAASNDIEPEYVAVSPDGTRAYVTLQEVNAVAVIDLTDPSATKPIAIQPLGSIDRSLTGNAFDGNDQNGVNLVNFDVASLPQPDAVASFEVGGATYFVTANEGDARVGLIDEVRLSSGSYVLDPTAYPNAAAIKSAIGRLNVITTAGDSDGDGDYDQITTYGGRGISIFRQNEDGTIVKVRETGGEFEAIIARDFPALHNTENLAGPDNRSDNKGPEPEGVSIGVVSGRTYAFVNLERVGGVMVYDITDPANAQFVSFKPATGQDFAPEVNKFISAEDSSTGAPILLTANEVSNTITLYSVVSQTEGDDILGGGAAADSFNGKGGDDLLIGNDGADNLDGGDGSDTVSYANAKGAVNVNFATGVVTGADGADVLANIENAIGSAFNDLLTGDANANELKGLAGNDRLNGGDGDDVLNGGLGGDVLAGGAGSDMASYADAASAVSVSLLSGRGSFGEAVGDRLSGIENLTGSAFADVLTGNRLTNIIHGGAGDDIIEGEGGPDQLFGDEGDDVFIIEAAPQLASIDGGTGFDTIRAGADDTAIKWAPFTGIEAISGDGYANVTIAGGSAGDVIDLSAISVIGIAAVNGNGGHDTITGSGAADRLNGQGGNDTLLGDGGADIVAGGLGVDQLGGGAGADSFLFLRPDSGRTAATADTILDFASSEGDRIDLAGIDANSANGTGDDGFAFIGAAAFTGVAGDLRYEAAGADLFVSADLNGDARADFMIRVANTASLAAADFLL